MTEGFAAVGAFAIFVVSVIMLGAVVSLVVSSIREWLQAKRDLTTSTKNLIETQRLLMEANNNLNERVKALEEKRESNAEAVKRWS